MRRIHGYSKQRYLRTALPVVLLAAAAVTLTTAAASHPSAPSSVPTETTLVHRLDTCLAPGEAKPTVVLVHGAWADASSWSAEVATLQAAGYDARAIANPLQDLTTDSEYVADYLKAIHGPIVLVGHSYGGAVITNAAAGMTNVRALVYVDAAAPAPGETNGQLSGATSILNTDTPAQLFFTTPYPGAPSGADELYLNENIFIHYFASDLPVREAATLWASQRGASTAAFDTPSKKAAWQTIPSWYFISTGDQIITPASELMMAHRAVQPRVVVERVRAEEDPASRPEQVTAELDIDERPVGQYPDRAVQAQRLGDHGAGAHEDRDQVAVIRARPPVATDDAGQQGAQPPVGCAEPPVGASGHPREPGNVRGDAPGHEPGEQHPQQSLDLVDHIRADVAGKECPGQHGERHGPHLTVEGERATVRPGSPAGTARAGHGRTPAHAREATARPASAGRHGQPLRSPQPCLQPATARPFPG
jgi:pimeloyl-ACP methyl ester carboxylesterase